MNPPLEVTYPDLLRPTRKSKGTCVALHGACAEVLTRNGAALMDVSTLTPDPREVWVSQQATRKAQEQTR